MPEKTKAEFRDDGFFITGDLGKIDANGYVAYRRPRQGSRDLGRLQRLSQGSRERNRRASRRRRKRGHRCRRIPISAKALSLSWCAQESPTRRDARSSTRSESGSPISSCRRRAFRRRTSAQHDGKGAEKSAAPNLWRSIRKLKRNAARPAGVRELPTGDTGCEETGFRSCLTSFRTKRCRGASRLAISFGYRSSAHGVQRACITPPYLFHNF